MIFQTELPLFPPFSLCRIHRHLASRCAGEWSNQSTNGKMPTLRRRAKIHSEEINLGTQKTLVGKYRYQNPLIWRGTRLHQSVRQWPFWDVKNNGCWTIAIAIYTTWTQLKFRITKCSVYYLWSGNVGCHSLIRLCNHVYTEIRRMNCTISCVHLSFHYNSGIEILPV